MNIKLIFYSFIFLPNFYKLQYFLLNTIFSKLSFNSIKKTKLKNRVWSFFGADEGT